MGYMSGFSCGPFFVDGEYTGKGCRTYNMVEGMRMMGRVNDEILYIQAA